MILYTTILVSSFSSERRARAVTVSCVFKVYTVVEFKAGQDGPLFAYTVTSVQGYYLCRKSSMLIRCQRLGGFISPAWSPAALEMLVALARDVVTAPLTAFVPLSFPTPPQLSTRGPFQDQILSCCVLPAARWKLRFD